MFSVEYTLGRRSRSKSASFAAPIERLSCDRGNDGIDEQIEKKQRSGLQCWARLMAKLRTANIVPSGFVRPDRS
jgi:hypothetical protein